MLLNCLYIEKVEKIDFIKITNNYSFDINWTKEFIEKGFIFINLEENIFTTFDKNKIGYFDNENKLFFCNSKETIENKIINDIYNYIQNSFRIILLKNSDYSKIQNYIKKNL